MSRSLLGPLKFELVGRRAEVASSIPIRMHWTLELGLVAHKVPSGNFPMAHGILEFGLAVCRVPSNFQMVHWTPQRAVRQTIQ